MPSSTASVSGRLMVNVDPLTGARRDRDAPAQRLDRALDHVHADAAAGDVGDGRGGREARQEDQVVDFPVGELRVGGDQSVLIAISRTRGRSMPAPSSATSMMMRPERCAAARRTLPCAGLPAAIAHFRLLEAVVDRVADHVGQRIGEPLDHRPVDFGRFALGMQTHLLADASATSRTILDIRWNTDFTGWARIAITLSWISRVSCSSCPAPRRRRQPRRGRPRAPAASASPGG